MMKVQVLLAYHGPGETVCQALAAGAVCPEMSQMDFDQHGPGLHIVEDHSERMIKIAEPPAEYLEAKPAFLLRR